MTHKVTMLGCGLVGGTIVRDLAADPDLEILALDVSERNLDALARLPRVTTRRGDLSKDSVIEEAVRGADVVVGAVPGRLGFAMLRTVIECGRPICDISFFPEDALELDSLAKQKNVTAVVDCGVSPGLSNVAIGRAASKLDTVRSAVIYVGGLPVERHWPYEYRIVFSATDVIEEYTRPARLIEDGRLVVKPALSEVELLDLPGVGTLEAFNTDGLRSLIRTVKATNMKEKTLRYPGHAERMRMLRETGFFSDAPVEVDGAQVSPRKVTERLLFDAWLRSFDEVELTVMRVQVEGERAGKAKRFVYDLLDYTDMKTGMTSMARTTGFPCAIIARMIARGMYRDPGVHPPEHLGSNDELCKALFAELRQRGVNLTEKEE